MKKIIGIISLALLVGSYFLYQYRTKQIAERVNEPKGAIADRSDYSGSPLNSDLRNILLTYWKETGKENRQETSSKGIGVMGGENRETAAREIYIISFEKDGNKSFVVITPALYFDPDKAVSYTYFDDNLIVYYGDKGGIDNEMIDMAKMSDEFDLIRKYNMEGKPPVGETYKSIEKKYELK